MIRPARALLLVFALACVQQGALLHAFEHAAHKANIAALDHEIEKCVAYDAVGHALDASAEVALEPIAPAYQHASATPFLAIPARIVFDSRAPPYSA